MAGVNRRPDTTSRRYARYPYNPGAWFAVGALP